MWSVTKAAAGCMALLGIVLIAGICGLTDQGDARAESERVVPAETLPAPAGPASGQDGEVPAKPAPARPDPHPFRLCYTMPEDGEVALTIERADGVRVRNLTAQSARTRGNVEEPWDLKDDDGRYIPPGTYRLRGVAVPPLQLAYQFTLCPNIGNFFPDRAPWLIGHSGPDGWLSDHSQNWACASRGDRVYFGAPMAEAGVCFIECDLDGRKLWGKHDFGAWRGVNRLAADDEAVYIEATDGFVYRMNPATREIVRLFGYQREGRGGSLRAIAAARDRVYLAFGGEPTLDGVTTAENVDLDSCLPTYPARVKGDRVPPSPQLDFLRVIRLRDPPPGQHAPEATSKPPGVWPVCLDSTFGAQHRQYVVIAFRSPVPIGSIVFPHPGGETKVDFSFLRRDSPYPPRPREDSDWIPFADQGQPGWNCIPAPEHVATRAIRIRFTRPGDDTEEMLDGTPKEDGPQPGLDANELSNDALEAKGEKRGRWLGRLDGLRLLRRRFRNLATSATIRISSGVLLESGEWDAQRKEAVWRDNPGIYLMEWGAPQKIAGLAVKEIDGAVTEVDAWQGDGAIPLDGTAVERGSRQPGWRHIATYRQQRRSAYEPSFWRNAHARYLDGMVDFGEIVTTRALRLRIVEPWMDNGDKNSECRRHDGRSEHGVHYMQSHTAQLDTRFCRVLGVAPLEYIGGETPVDPNTYCRLEVYDGRDGRLIREVPARLGWNGMSCGPDGTLYSIHENHQEVIALDPESGRATVILKGTEPSKMAVGPDGQFYIHPWSDDGKAPIRVYDREGNRVREIGHPGGLPSGPWDPMRIGSVGALCVDRRGSLWIAESEQNPRRILQYDTRTGTLVKEILGNTSYGGGGVLHRYDKTRAFLGRVEFRLDWETHTARIRRLLPVPGDLVALRVQNHTYLTSAPLGHSDRQGHAVVYLDDDPNALPRMVAAFGDAALFDPLRSSVIISRMDGAPPKEFLFLWSDRNGNGSVDVEEMELQRKTDGDRWHAVGRFDPRLGCMAPSAYYEAREFLADGTPIYRRTRLERGGHLRLANGNTLALHSYPAEGSRIENYAAAPSGQKIWGYPVREGGVSGLQITPWKPGQVGNEFGIIGHETAGNEALGEFAVVHANTGQWTVWTADGLLASQILLHKSDPRSRFFGPPSPKPGMRLDPLTASQEHFHGFFTRTEPDGKYYIVAGFTHMSLIEVQGLDRCHRIEAEVPVSAEDLAKAREWDTQQTRATIEAKAMKIDACWFREPPIIDGDAGPHEWVEEGTPLAEREVTFRIGTDGRFLYLCWSGKGIGELRNSGKEFQRAFKTGACLDLMLGTRANASPERRTPVEGDLRLLLTFVDDRPQAVLYEPVCPGSPPEEKWSTFTEAGGRTSFDRVVLLGDVRMAMKRREETTTVEAAVPLATVRLTDAPGKQLKMDWGVLTSNDGLHVKERAYWANAVASGTSDEATEARLEPHLWGSARFPLRDGMDHIEEQLRKTEDGKSPGSDDALKALDDPRK